MRYTIVAPSLEQQGSGMAAQELRPRKRLKIAQQHDELENAISNRVSFLHLPTEVREMIYQGYFTDVLVFINSPKPPRFCFRKDGRETDGGYLYENREDPENSLENIDIYSLFMTSKLVGAEARQSFYRTATFTAGSRDAFSNALRRSNNQQLPLLSAGQNPAMRNPFWYIQDVRVDLTRLTNKLGTPEKSGRASTQATFEIMHFSMPSLKRCTVIVDPYGGPHRRSKSPLLSDWFLKCLCQMQNLDNFPLLCTWVSGARTVPRDTYNMTYALNTILQPNATKHGQSALELPIPFDDEGVCMLEVQLQAATLMLEHFESHKDQRMIDILKHQIEVIEREIEVKELTSNRA